MMIRFLYSAFKKLSLNSMICMAFFASALYSSAILAGQEAARGDFEIGVETFGDQVRLIEVNTPDGVIKYGYDGYGRLSRVIYPDHGIRRYHYDNLNFPNLLTAITDKNGARITTDRYDGVAKVAFYARAKSIEDSIRVRAHDAPAIGATTDLCPNTIFDDGKIWSGDIQYVDNVCSNAEQICVDTFFSGLNERFDAICLDNEWQLANPTPEIESLDRCPNAVFDNGRMWSSEIELVGNSCSSAERTCPDTFFSSIGRYLDAVCTGTEWQPLGIDLSATDICPNTIFGDGSMLSGDFQVMENSCASVKQVCPNTWYADDQEFSGSVCNEGNWQRQPKGTDLLPPLSSIDVNLPVGGAIGFAWLLALFGLVVTRLRLNTFVDRL